jgi:aspartate aminotransferase
MTTVMSAPFSDAVARIKISSTIAVTIEAEKMRAEGLDLVDFGAGEPDFPTPEHIKQAGIRAIEANFTRYTAAGGTSELRRAVCDFHRREFGSNFEPAEALVTVGGKHAIFNVACALLNAGDEVILPVPYWVSFRDIVEYAGGKCVFVPTREEDGYELRPEAVEAAFTPRTRLVILNSPNNPSGAVIRPEVMERIARAAARRGVWTLSDECYAHLVYEGQPWSLAAVAAGDPELRERLVLAVSLSKTFAMTGWRCGFALGPRDLVAEMLKLQSHSTSNVTSITQKAALAALTGPMDAVEAMRAEYRRRRDFVVDELNSIPGITCPKPGGAFYAYPNIAAFLSTNGASSAADIATRLLREAQVALVPGEAFGATSHLRLSYAASLEDLTRGLERMRRFFAAR